MVTPIFYPFLSFADDRMGNGGTTLEDQSKAGHRHKNYITLAIVQQETTMPAVSPRQYRLKPLPFG